MTAPNMAAITASLERSLQNCSLNHHQSRGVLGGAGERSSSSDDVDFGTQQQQQQLESEEDQNHHHNISSSSDTALELNSHLSLPYHWEQCLDLKTGEIYYINWRNGMKAKEDPRVTQEYYSGEEDDSSYDSEESSSEYSPPSSSSRDHYNNNNNNNRSMQHQQQKKDDHVLVVAGCKSCLMYFMVPKQVEDCPKCNGQLLHFDRSENGSP